MKGLDNPFWRVTTTQCMDDDFQQYPCLANTECAIWIGTQRLSGVASTLRLQ